MQDPTSCPKCKSENIYQDGNLWVCPECANEWMPVTTAAAAVVHEEADEQVRDAHGVVLADGDTVIVMKDLKVKGASGSVKAGTKVKNIRLYDQGFGHNISCKIDGFGAMNLKSEFVKKA